MGPDASAKANRLPRVSPLWLAAKEKAWGTLEALLDVSAETEYGWRMPLGEPSALALLCAHGEGETGARLAKKMLNAGISPMEASVWPDSLAFRGIKALGSDALPCAAIAFGADDPIRAEILAALSLKDMGTLATQFRGARSAAVFGCPEWIAILVKAGGALERKPGETPAIELAPDAKTLAALEEHGANPLEAGDGGESGLARIMSRSKASPEGRAMAKLAGQIAARLAERGGKDVLSQSAFDALRADNALGAREAIAALGAAAPLAKLRGNWSLLHEAAFRGKWADAARLMKLGADPFEVDENGSSAFSIAGMRSVPSGRSYGFSERTREQEAALAFFQKLQKRRGVNWGPQGPGKNSLAEGFWRSGGKYPGPLGDFWENVLPRAVAAGWNPAEGSFLGRAFADNAAWLANGLRGREPGVDPGSAEVVGKANFKKLLEIAKNAQKIGGGEAIAQSLQDFAVLRVLGSSFEWRDFAAKALADSGPANFQFPDVELDDDTEFLSEFKALYENRLLERQGEVKRYASGKPAKSL